VERSIRSPRGRSRLREAARRWRAWLGPLAGFLLLWVLLGLTAGQGTGDGAREILDRARSILGQRPPGMGRPHYPPATTWIAVPLAWTQALAGRLSSASNRAEYLTRTAPFWAAALRALWAALASVMVLLAGRIARRAARVGAGHDAVSGEQAGGEGIAPAPDERTRGEWIAAAAAIALLAGAPALAVSIRELTPSLPAGILIALLFAAVLDPAASRGTRVGLAGGALLAWFPFCWPALLAALIALALAGARPALLVRAVALALFLGVVLEPSHLLRAGEIPAQIRAEWLRQGGGAGPGGPGLAGFLALAAALGPVAWFFWIPASIPPRRRRALAVVFFVVAVWALQVALPGLRGARRPGAVQGSLAPLLAIWAAAPLAGLTRARAGRTGALVAALILAGSALPSRLVSQKRVGEVSEIRREVAREMSALVGDSTLWVCERPVLGQVAEDGAGFAGHGFVLPRDSRAPGRYDYAYWPRWYAGFRWVLLSSAQVRENLARANAQVPPLFYRGLESSSSLVREWGGTGEGFRLYKILPGSEWTRPLREEELNDLRGGPQQTWFLSVLGSLYAQAGDLRTAALLFRRGIEWDSSAVSLYNNLGAVYMREREYAAAAASFEQGLRRAPRAFEILLNYGRLCGEQNLFGRAEILLRRAVAVRPDYPAVHYELARVFLAQGKKELTEEALTRYLALDPHSPNRAEVVSVLSSLKQGGTAGALSPAREGGVIAPSTVADSASEGRGREGSGPGPP
jgi:tetratricopeptide (TPR) repeat protein